MTPRFTPRSQTSMYGDDGHTYPTDRCNGAGHDPTPDPTHPTAAHPTFSPLSKEGETCGVDSAFDREALRAELDRRAAADAVKAEQQRRARAEQRRQFAERRTVGLAQRHGRKLLREQQRRRR